MDRILKILLFALLVRPVVFVILGLNIRNRNNLPKKGPAVIASNHNSHLDTVVLMSLYPLSQIHKVRPVAAADYFLSNKLISWFSLKCIGIIPINRRGASNIDDLFAKCHEALDNGDILIIFPEGSRGKPEEISKIKKGLFYLVKDRENTPIIPVVTRGLGKSLPRGEGLFVPFNCDVIIGGQLQRVENSKEFTSLIQTSFDDLLEFCITGTN